MPGTDASAGPSINRNCHAQKIRRRPILRAAIPLLLSTLAGRRGRSLHEREIPATRVEPLRNALRANNCGPVAGKGEQRRD